MRRHHFIIGAIAVLGLAGCGASGGTESKPAPTPITAPATKAQGTVDQQNAQLQQMEQQTSSADPTVVP